MTWFADVPQQVRVGRSEQTLADHAIKLHDPKGPEPQKGERPVPTGHPGLC